MQIWWYLADESSVWASLQEEAVKNFLLDKLKMVWQAGSLMLKEEEEASMRFYFWLNIKSFTQSSAFFLRCEDWKKLRYVLYRYYTNLIQFHMGW